MSDQTPHKWFTELAEQRPYAECQEAHCIPQLWEHYVEALMFKEDGSREDNEKRAAAIICIRHREEPTMLGWGLEGELINLAGDFYEGDYFDFASRLANVVDQRPAPPARDESEAT